MLIRTTTSVNQVGTSGVEDEQFSCNCGCCHLVIPSYTEIVQATEARA